MRLDGTCRCTTLSVSAATDLQLRHRVLTSVAPVSALSCSRTFGKTKEANWPSKKANQLFSVRAKPQLSACPLRERRSGVSAKWAAVRVGGSRRDSPDLWRPQRGRQTRAHWLLCDSDSSILPPTVSS